jgi:aspartyl-tRNA(Asn)/glutamyl-tRNA(Gln) amidotransferase subunit C
LAEDPEVVREIERAERFARQDLQGGRSGMRLELAWGYVTKNIMKMTPQDVQRVALLARLRLSGKEEEWFAQQLEKILQYMEKLNQLDTSGIEPFTHALDSANVLREDVVTNEACAEALLVNAPAKHGTFFKVPKIIE